jgi:NitT/TauT family transport system ATP-binding protein
MNAILVDQVSVSFGKTQVLDKISLTVQEEEMVALIGPSGCGKSTLLRVVAGIVPKMVPATYSGVVTVSRPMDMVFQASTLLPWRTAKGNVSLGLELTKNHHPGKAEKLLEQVGLGDFLEIVPAKLSGGMKQRVNLASSLITEPKVLLMDEPFANLDSLTREKMWLLVTKLKLLGIIQAVLLVTHSIEEAAVLSDRVLVMSPRPGRITAEILVPIPRPRLISGSIPNQEFFDVANTIRAAIKNGGE